MQGIGWHVIDLLDSILESLHDHALLFVNDIGILVPLNRSRYKLAQHVSVQLVSQVVGCWVNEACIWALELGLFDHLKRTVLNQDRIWLERVNQLLSELYARSLLMHTSVHDDGLTAHLVLQNEDTVLEVKVNAEFLRVQVNAPQPASLQRHFLPLDFLEQIQVPCVELHGSHLGEHGVQGCFVLLGQQKAMFVHMGVELFDHFGLILLEVALASHRDSEQDHLAGIDNAAHFGANTLEQGIVEELVADSDTLALVEGLQKMI